MEVIVEEEPVVKEDTIEITMHDWIVSDEKYKEDKAEWDKNNIKEPSLLKTSYKEMIDVHEKNKSGYESTMEKRLKTINEEYIKVYNILNLPYYHELEKKDQFVQVYENALSNDFCDHIIDFFNNNPDYRSKYSLTSEEALLINENRLNELDGLVGVKKTSEMYVNTEYLEKEDIYISQQLNKYLNKYVCELNLPYIDFKALIGCQDSGYNIQKYKQNEGRYLFHQDGKLSKDKDKVGYRTLTFIFYLNDVEEGGETTFPEFQVKPKKGSLLLFPATWNYLHSGNIPKSGDKYIITGWIWKYLSNHVVENGGK